MEYFFNFIATPIGTITLSLIMLVAIAFETMLDRKVLNQKSYQKLYSTVYLFEYSIGALAVYLLYARDIKINIYYVLYAAIFEFVYLYTAAKLAKKNITAISSVGGVSSVLALLFLQKQFALMAVVVLAVGLSYALFLSIKKPNKFLLLSFFIIILQLAMNVGDEFFWVIIREDGIMAYSLLIGYLLFVLINSIVKKTPMIDLKLIARPMPLTRIAIGSITLTISFIIYNKAILEIYLAIIAFRSFTTLLLEQRQDKSPRRQTVKLAIIILSITAIGYFLKGYLDR